MAQFQVETTIQSPIDTVFQLIADISNYARWLSTSGTFNEITLLSDSPIGRGTHYRDNGPSTRMEGTVVEYDPPHRLVFQQNTQQRLYGIPSTMAIRITYQLTTDSTHTHVVRHFNGELHGAFRLFQPYVISTIKRENQRILAAMKAYLER